MIRGRSCRGLLVRPFSSLWSLWFHPAFIGRQDGQLHLQGLGERWCSLRLHSGLHRHRAPIR